MSDIVRERRASRNEVSLYCLMGEALCAVQHVEDALSHLIALKVDVKKPGSMPKGKADKVLDKYRTSYTLGGAIKLSREKRLYDKQLEECLGLLLSERNWLVHRCGWQSHDFINCEERKGELFFRIKDITRQSQKVLALIEEDMMVFSEANGLETAGILREIEKYYAQG